MMLQRRNPCMKLLAVVLVGLGVTFVYDPATAACIFALTLLAGRLFGGLRFRDQLKPLTVFVVVGIGILLANILFNKHNGTAHVLATLGPLKVTGTALWTAATLWMRLMCFALLSLVFVKTTPPQDLILSLVQQLHMNYRVAYGTMVGYRMLPLLQADYQSIQDAQRARGVREGRGPISAWRRVRRHAIPLLAGSVRKAGRVALAMDARGFGAFPSKTYRVKITVNRSDWLFVAGVAVVLVALLTGLWFLGVARFAIG